METFSRIEDSEVRRGPGADLSAQFTLGDNFSVRRGFGDDLSAQLTLGDSVRRGLGDDLSAQCDDEYKVERPAFVRILLDSFLLSTDHFIFYPRGLHRPGVSFL